MRRCAKCRYLLRHLILTVAQNLIFAAHLPSDRKVHMSVDEGGDADMQSRLLRTEKHRRFSSSLVELDGPGNQYAKLAKAAKATLENMADEEAEPKVDCQWTDWSDWEACSSSCGDGKKKRTREVKPRWKDQNCKGEGEQEKDCNLQECPKDCQLSDWQAWSSCEPFCSGTRQRQRTIIQPMQNGGMPCANLSEAEDCSNPCLDCSWSQWTEWADCSKSCGQGISSRERNQTYAPKGNAASALLLQLGTVSQDIAYEKRMNVKCDVDHMKALEFEKSSEKTLSLGELRLAAKKACIEDEACTGIYEESCNGTFLACLEGFALVYEPGSCSYSKKDIGKGTNCTGPSSESKQCGAEPCPVDCVYDDWKAWGQCEPLCNGTQSRARDIKIQAANGGTPCDETTQGRGCSNVCVDCKWSQWSTWSDCSKTCGGGKGSRTRLVATPAQGEGKNCTGKDTYTRNCNSRRCPVDCVTSDWTSWTTCSPYCSGTQSRSRSLKSRAAYGGSCPPLEQTRVCANFCMDCQLGEWTSWNDCSKSCGGGWINRSRTEVYVQRNQSSLLQQSTAGKTWGYAKKMGFRCDAAHRGQADSAGMTPEQAEKACSADPQCTGLYDQGCDNFFTMCFAGFLLESEAGSCTYEKKEIGEGQPCTGDVAEAKECNAQSCPVDCIYKDWTAWGDCMPACNGTRIRNRSIKVNASSGGAACDSVSEVASCSDQPCPTDCAQSEWTDWTECSPYCQGEQTRTRFIVRPAMNGGRACGEASQLRNCSNVCQDCKWTDWTVWSDCNPTCGDATRKRFRGISSPRIGGGANCSGEVVQGMECSPQPCAVDCEMTDWTPWSECVPICNGTQVRSRNVTVQPNFLGQSCGELFQKAACSSVCVDCQLADWTEWGACSETCGGGTTNRSRPIRIPAQGNGEPCPSPDLNETKTCAENPCPLNCKWYDWGPWDGCNVSCGVGARPRMRQKQILAMNGGDDCPGPEIETQPCGEPCPQDCKWGDWMEWGNCPLTCGGSERMRLRIQERQAVGDGLNCSGESFEKGICADVSCPKDCAFHDWTSWSNCSVSCGQGFQLRTREMNYEQFGGKSCNGSVFQNQECSPAPCPQHCAWSEWDPWSHCTKSCKESNISGPGKITRHRQKHIMAAFGGLDCDGTSTESQECCRDDCEWMPWSDWGVCNFTCGHAPQRHRSRTNTPGGPGGLLCDGPSNETGVCQSDQCSQDCIWEDWQEWETCSHTCGLSSTRLRRRRKVQEALGPKGIKCSGSPSEEVACSQLTPCPVDCRWGDWRPWSDCESLRKNSDQGKRLRTRILYPATYGGAECSGKPTHVQNCSLNSTVERFLAESSVIVAITESVVVDNPSSFANDPEAADVIRASTASALGLSPGDVVLRSMHAGNGSQALGPAALSSLELTSVPAHDVWHGSGNVEVEYEVLCEGRSHEECYSNATQLNTTELNSKLQQQLQERGRSYQVQVKELDISEVDQVTRNKLNETVIRSVAQSRCKVFMYCLVFLLLLVVFSEITAG
eukprot:TRINITY_DN30169_c0_g2_i1.p1 TRINITY_DN30169_c0_g2~~TRINITY_DN30169_c0_g2_i1.p1  ORF type:complete len:1516 (+),score=202.90 TRINITY_DN30169_c0_g2_i1:88-4635(+)